MRALSVICNSGDVKRPLIRERISSNMYYHATGETTERNGSDFSDMVQLIKATKPARERIKTVIAATGSVMCRLGPKGPSETGQS